MEIHPTIESFEKPKARIELHFFRHDEKEGDPLKNDYDIELSPSGREHAKAQAGETNLAQSVAFGSPRKRTQETAGLIMAGANDEITGQESLDELKEKVDKGLKYGSKINVDQNLNFELEGDTEYVKAALDAYKKGEFITFLIEKSDELAKETGDDLSSTYSRMSASIAKIIEKYIGVIPRWNELVNDESKSYDQTLERFLGTHQTMQECFLAKVIDRTKGREVRDQFLTLLKNKGFGYSEGFEAEIIKSPDSDNPTVRIKYSKKAPDDSSEDFVFDEEIPLEIIQEIAEGK